MCSVVGRHITLTTYNLFYILQRTIVNSRGVLCVARDKERPIILEFTSFQDTIMFNKRSRFGLEKVKNSKINVKVVLDMECGNI